MTNSEKKADFKARFDALPTPLREEVIAYLDRLGVYEEFVEPKAERVDAEKTELMQRISLAEAYPNRKEIRDAVLSAWAFDASVLAMTAEALLDMADSMSEARAQFLMEEL